MGRGVAARPLTTDPWRTRFLCQPRHEITGSRTCLHSNSSQWLPTVYDLFCMCSRLFIQYYPLSTEYLVLLLASYPYRQNMHSPFGLRLSRSSIQGCSGPSTHIINRPAIRLFMGVSLVERIASRTKFRGACEASIWKHRRLGDWARLAVFRKMLLVGASSPSILGAQLSQKSSCIPFFGIFFEPLLNECAHFLDLL